MRTPTQPNLSDTPVPREPLVPDPVLYFALPGLLPTTYRFAYHEQLHTLNLLSVTDEGPVLLRDQRFTTQEASMLVPLLRAYPNYCSYAILHAHFVHPVVTEKEITHSQQCLAAALRMGTSEREMRPLRNVLSRTRIKLLASFNIDIATIQEVGCLLLSAGHTAHTEGYH
jgi:hypothetical protein